ncbi:MAG: type IV secretion system DNA-binding domain-containing protein [bacterium]
MFRWLSSLIEKGIVSFYEYIQQSKFIQEFFSKWQKSNTTIDTLNIKLLSLGKVAKEYYPDQLEDIFIDAQLRLRHTYILGATGSGKTNLLESFLRQDIKNKNGFCLIDCHGDLANNIVSYLASQSNGEKGKNQLIHNTIFIEPFNKKWVIGFNPLKAKNKESRYSQAIEVLSIFQKIWGKDVFGPRTSELFRNTLLTLMENDLTLLEAAELLTNDYFRNSLLDKISISEVKNYWLCRYNPLSDKMKAMYREAVINKLTVFTSDPQIRLMLGSKENTLPAGGQALNFTQAMNEGKWIILNLAKGYLKENMNLLATLFISHLLSSTLERINIPYQQRNPFYLYIDEFQNFCHSPDLITLLSEARKYGLGTILCHQHAKQIEQDILKAILGNTQTQIYFRQSYQDSLFFAPEINPRWKEGIAKTLIDLETGKAYLKIKGQPSYLLSTPLCSKIAVSKQEVKEFKGLVLQTHGKSKREIIEEIEERTKSYGGFQAVGITAPELIEQEIREREDIQDGW